VGLYSIINRKRSIYDKGDTVTNPFSGDTYELNNLELSMYDLIMGSQMVQKYDLTRKGSARRAHNPKVGSSNLSAATNIKLN